MTAKEALANIKHALNTSPRNGYVAELHLQTIKHADALNDITGKEFTEALGIGASFGTEFAKMRKISNRLIAAGLDVTKI